ncbi:AGAP005133-PA-like protein [Anopheles sinensis]|uniref:AGAP005133-PA-like protein n=1 Tax=Anopheles sinensis TaxID=74873 RepID=A0A084W9J6_ANOSI|nr:AGAP005133-PA-like protein [Anopheles sinensis]
MPHSKSLDHYQDTSSASAAAAAAAAAATPMYGMNVGCMQRHSIDQPYHFTPNSMYGGHFMGVAPAPYEGTLDEMCAVGGGGGPGGGAVFGNNHHPYNNVPGTNGRYNPMPNFPTGPVADAMYGAMMNGVAGAEMKPNGNLMEGGGCYRHGALNGGSFMSHPLFPPGYPGQMHPSYYMPDPSMVPSGAKQHLGSSSYDTSSSSMATQTAYPSAPQPGASILSSKKKIYNDYDVPQPSSGAGLRHGSEQKSAGGGGKKLDRYHKNAELLIDYESDMLPEALVERNNQKEYGGHHHHHHHHLHHQTSRNSRQSDFDSYEDEQQQQQQQLQHEPSSVNRRKNQDGIGCYDSWNFVYENLQKQGYSKDLGERGDFFTDELGVEGQGVEEEDMAAIRRRRAKVLENDPSGGSRRESTSGGSTLRRSNNEKLKAMKAKAADKVDGIVRQSGSTASNATLKPERRHERQSSAGGGPAGSGSGSLVQKMAKASISSRQHSGEDLLGLDQYQQAVATGGSSSSRRNSVTKKQTTALAAGSPGSVPPKESNNNTTTSGILVNHHHIHQAATSASSISTATTTTTTLGPKKKTATFDTGAVTIINPSPASTPTIAGATSSSEWNCNFCTFLNPDGKRICDMCSKSRDFRLDGANASNGTATCV